MRVVKSSFVDGNMDAPTALIPGADRRGDAGRCSHLPPAAVGQRQRVGCGAVLETARVLQTLITGGSTAATAPVIRFLLPPEMYGTYAYLASDEQRIARTLAAINLDMVGENQELCGSSFLVERLPQAMAAPVDTLAIAIQEALAQEQHGLQRPRQLRPLPLRHIRRSTAAATTTFCPTPASASPAPC